MVHFTGACVAFNRRCTCKMLHVHVLKYGLCLLFLCGFVLNARKLCSHARSIRNMGKYNPACPKSRKCSNIKLLLININLADLLLICTFLPLRVALMHTRGEWLASNDLVCKTVSFVVMLWFHACAYLVVATALIRATTVCYWQSKAPSRFRVLGATAIAWLTAILCACPQAVWWHSTTIPNVYAKHNGYGLLQTCISVWEKKHIRDVFLNLSGSHTPHAIALQRYYEFHTTTLFWLPSLLVFVSCVIILARVLYGGWLCATRRPGIQQICAKVARRVSAVVLVHLGSWLPSTVATIATTDASDGSMLSYLNYFVVLGSVVNPLLYHIDDLDEPYMPPSTTTTSLSRIPKISATDQQSRRPSGMLFRKHGSVVSLPAVTHCAEPNKLLGSC